MRWSNERMCAMKRGIGCAPVLFLLTVFLVGMYLVDHGFPANRDSLGLPVQMIEMPTTPRYDEMEVLVGQTFTVYEGSEAPYKVAVVQCDDCLIGFTITNLNSDLTADNTALAVYGKQGGYVFSIKPYYTVTGDKTRTTYKLVCMPGVTVSP